MTTTYLSQSTSVRLDLFGRGSVDLKPPVGQYWAPKFIRVSTLSQGSPVAYCAVYHGAVTIKNQTTFLDDTFLGNGDTSSIISGTLLRFGEAITAVWDGGNANDTAILTVWGIASDVPPTFNDEMPAVPGTHFAGKPNTELTILAGDIFSGQNISGGGTLVVPQRVFGSTGSVTIADVRSFGSYYLALTGQIGVATKYNPVNVLFQWFADSAATREVYRDEVNFWAGSNGGAFIFTNSTMEMQDVHHGPYFSVTILNQAGNDTLSFLLQLVHSSRQLPGPSVRQFGSTNGILAMSSGPIPVGGTIFFPLYYGHGETQITLVNPSAGAITFNMNYTGTPVGLGGSDNMTPNPIPAGSVQVIRWIMPKEGGMISAVGAVGANVGVRVISEFAKS